MVDIRVALSEENDRLTDTVAKQAARIEQLEAEAQSRTLDYLGQVGQLSEELERVKREAERAQDAHGVRFLNYLEETARLTDRIEQLEAALREIMGMDEVAIVEFKKGDGWLHQRVARAALEDRT